MREASVDAVGRGRRAQFGHGVIEDVALVVERIESVARDDRFIAQREEARGPASIAAGGAKATELLLQHRDAQRRVAPQQLARGPETSEATAHDRHVDVEMSLRASDVA